jgi:Na+-transporting methylmalonyl-CoA/oxaloacetate decarboxylase gamma subunit
MANLRQKIVVGVNFVFLVFGIILVAMAKKWDTVQEKYGDTVPNWVGTLGMAVGSMVIVVSLMGFLGGWCYDKKWAKCLLFIYSFLLLVIVIIQLVIGAVAASTSSELQDNATAKDKKNMDKTLYKFANATWTKCCNNDTKWGTGTSKKDPCKSWLPDNVRKDCPVPSKFREGLFNYIAEKMAPIKYVMFIFGAIMFITMCSACTLICSKKKKEAEQPPPMM